MSDSETTSNGSLIAELDAELEMALSGDHLDADEDMAVSEFTFNTPPVDPITPQLTNYKQLSAIQAKNPDFPDSVSFSNRMAALESTIQVAEQAAIPPPNDTVEPSSTKNPSQHPSGSTATPQPPELPAQATDATVGGLDLPHSDPAVQPQAAQAMQIDSQEATPHSSTSTPDVATKQPTAESQVTDTPLETPPAMLPPTSAIPASAPARLPSGQIQASKRRRVLLSGRKAGGAPSAASTEHGGAQLAAGDAPVVEAPAECPPHPSFWNGMCTRCGAPKPDDTEQTANEQVLAIRHLHSAHLEVSAAEASRIRAEHHMRLLASGRLTLVLDLDHTLLHSVRTADVAPVHHEMLMRVLAAQDAAGQGRHKLLHYLPDKHLWTKLRPGVFEFLNNMQEFFELCIYTMGDRFYAREVARILDPGGRLFAGRVVAKDDGTTLDSKGLDVLLSDEHHVLVLDDTEQVWRQHLQNLIQVERYHYFPCRDHLGQATPHCFLESGLDESASSGMLAVCARVLRDVHSRFFAARRDDPTSNQDVRYYLSSVRSAILHGCTIVFSRCWPQDLPNPYNHVLWVIAEGLGAECSTQYDPDSTTHVVAASGGTGKVSSALADGKAVVSRDWLFACAARWERLPEADFSLAAVAARRNERGSGRAISALPVEPGHPVAAAPRAAAAAEPGGRTTAAAGPAKGQPATAAAAAVAGGGNGGAAAADPASTRIQAGDGGEDMMELTSADLAAYVGEALWSAEPAGAAAAGGGTTAAAAGGSGDGASASAALLAGLAAAAEPASKGVDAGDEGEEEEEDRTLADSLLVI